MQSKARQAKGPKGKPVTLFPCPYRDRYANLNATFRDALRYVGAAMESKSSRKLVEEQSRV